MTRSITLSLLKFLENAGLGVIDETLFWEKIGVGKNGVYITDLGATQVRGGRINTMYQLFSRAETDLEAMNQLQKILDYLNVNMSVCILPAVPPYTTEGFKNVTIMSPSTISNDGMDEEGHIIYSATGQIYYQGFESRANQS